MAASRFCVRSISAMVLLVTSFAAFAQSVDDKAKTTLNSGNTIKLQGKATVQESVQSCIAVEAVLLSRKPVMAMFSGFVADNYAVVQVTISNKCSDQQFLLHDIFFDYSNWSLSGVFAGPNPLDCSTRPSTETQGSGGSASEDKGVPPVTVASPPPTDPSDDCLFQKGTRPGQVATVGALDIQQQLQEAAIFSPRNLTINSLEILTSTAQAFAFPFTGDVSKGVGAFNTGLVTPLGKWWKDRSIDQSKYILQRGYRTDQTTAIAKDDHGSFYAFFPLNTFLIPDLKAVFKESPAAFLSPAELGLSNGLDKDFAPKKSKGGLADLRAKLLTLSQAVLGKTATWREVLIVLNQPCTADDLKAPAGQAQGGCIAMDSKPLTPASVVMSIDDQPAVSITAGQVVALKRLFAQASLNSVQIVARGVMTMDVSAIPPTIDTVTFDDEDKGKALWTGPTKAAGVSSTGSKDVNGKAKKAGASANGTAGTTDAAAGAGSDASSTGATDKGTEMTGTITGKFLQGGVPAIGAPVLPKTSTGSAAPKFTGLTVVKEKATDTSMPFKVTRVGDAANGTQLSFTVSRTSTNQDSGSEEAGATTQVTSNKFVYTVSYSPGPKISHVVIDDESAAWYKTGTVTGTITGTDLSGADLPNVKVTPGTLTIGGTAATLSDYISAGKVTLTSDSDDSKLAFSFKLSKAVESGKLVTLKFTVTTKAGTDSYEYKQAATATSAKKAPVKNSKKSAAPRAKTTGK